MAAYDASKHPEVIAGRKTKNEVFREFLDNFDGGEKDGVVTLLCPLLLVCVSLCDCLLSLSLSLCASGDARGVRALLRLRVRVHRRR